MDDTVLQRRPLPTFKNTNQKDSTSIKVHKVKEKVDKYWINDFPSFDYSYDDVIYYTKPRGPDPFPQRSPRKLPTLHKKQTEPSRDIDTRFLAWDTVVKDVDLIYDRNKMDSPGKMGIRHDVSEEDDTRNQTEEGGEEEKEDENTTTTTEKEVPSKKASIVLRQIFLDEQVREIDRLLKAEERPKIGANSFVSKNINLESVEELLVDACSFKVEKKNSSNANLEEERSEKQFLSEYSTAFKENVRVRSPTKTNEKTILDLRGFLDHHLPSIPYHLFDNLTMVNLSYNYFKTIPKQLFLMKNIVSLNMRNNPLNKISNKIKKLTKLKNLTLSFCRLTCLNTSVFALDNLERLDLSYNSLISINRDIDKLKSLKYLSVEGNQLEYFPRSILHINLISLSCHSNFLNAVFWKDSCPPFPQRLINIAMVSLAKLNRLDQVPRIIREKLFDGSRCPYCNVLVSGIGVAAIKPAMELFGVNNLPILFFVCSQTCKSKLQRATELPLVTSFN